MAELDALPRICTCPECGTRFRVTDEQLAQANGRVRCGACLTVFTPFASDEVEPQRDETPAEAAPVRPEAAPIHATDRPTRPTRRPASSPSAGWIAAYAVAATLLVVLVFALQAPVWSQSTALRGIYETACAVGPCNVAPLRALGAIKVERGTPNRVSESQPALTVPLELTNRAPFRQPFPELAIRAFSADNRALGERRFTPANYLPRGQSLEMTINKTVAVELRLPDPGPDATSYALSVY